MTQPEVWLRGPLPDIAPLLQPVAHSLLQCREEVVAALGGLTLEQIWSSRSDVAAVGFHVRHAMGSLDRLFTYARGETLSEGQLAALRAETQARAQASLPNSAELVEQFGDAVDRALAQLRDTPVSTLTDSRLVGRARLPSTVIGLLFHAAEHTQRHMGQMVTTVKLVRAAQSR
jgi:uncharacterized damage-inducible protein DinB